VVLPALSILFFGAPLIDRVKTNRHGAMFREGLQVGVLSLLFYATWAYGSVAVGSLSQFFMAAGAFFTLVLLEGKIHPILVVLACGLLGVFLF
jgi:chromate transport protein ChrA